MIFDYILGQLDGELARLEQLRAIVAGLRTPAPVAVALPELVLAPTPTLDPHTPTRPRLTRQRAAGPSVRRLPKPTIPEPRALTNVIPAGPVVVSAGALRDHAAQRKLLPAAAPETPDMDPEALLRELSQRWGTGATAHPA